MFNYYPLTIIEVGTAQSGRKKWDSLSVGIKIKKWEDLSYFKEVGRFVLFPPVTAKKQEDHLRSSWKLERMASCLNFFHQISLLDSGHFCFGKARGGDVDSIASDGAPGCPRGAFGNDCVRWLPEPLALSGAWLWVEDVEGARGMLRPIFVARKGAFHSSIL